MYFVILCHFENRILAFFSEDKELCRLNAEILGSFISVGFFWGQDKEDDKYLADTMYARLENDYNEAIIKIEKLSPAILMEECIQSMNKKNVEVELLEEMRENALPFAT